MLAPHSVTMCEIDPAFNQHQSIISVPILEGGLCRGQRGRHVSWAMVHVLFRRHEPTALKKAELSTGSMDTVG
jgi:hypothetical protein